MTAHPPARLGHAAIASVRHHHTGGHTCHDGRWYNDVTGTRTPCPAGASLDTARDQINRLVSAVHDAAHRPRIVDQVLTAMTGLDARDLDPDDRDAWRLTVQQAIEGLAAALDADHDLTARAQAAKDRAATFTRQEPRP